MMISKDGDIEPEKGVIASCCSESTKEILMESTVFGNEACLGHLPSSDWPPVRRTGPVALGLLLHLVLLLAECNSSRITTGE